jgi:hypothetical protein
MRHKAFWAPILVVAGVLGSALGCRDNGKVSVERAAQHAGTLAEIVKVDVAEVRQGLPEGAKTFVPLFRAGPAKTSSASSATVSPGTTPAVARPESQTPTHPAGFGIAAPLGSSASKLDPDTPETPIPDAPTVREALTRTRDRVQDLRVAKSTFFALTDANGIVLRNDQRQDLMATKPIFSAFPGLRQALGEKKYVETHGSMPEAAGVRGRADGQWVAAQPVIVDDQVRGLYVTGWSWSSYAYRLETSLRSRIRSESQGKSSEPLLYVFLVVGQEVFGAPMSPEVDIQAIAEQNPLSKLKGESVWTVSVSITNRVYALAVQRTPVLGPDVAIAVLRSEV